MSRTRPTPQELRAAVYRRRHGVHRKQPPLELRRKFGGRVPPHARDDRHRGRPR